MNRTDALQIPPDVLKARRDAALAALAQGVMVLPAAPVQYASRDGERPYHPDRELYYLTGATEPGSVAVLTGPDSSLTLFVRERDADAELWSGRRLGPDETAERLQPDDCRPLSELRARLPALLDRGDRVYFRLGRAEAGHGLDRLVSDALARARTRGARTGAGPRAVVDPGEVLDDLRLLKDAHELTRIARAAELSGEGHRVAARTIAPGVGEWAVEAAVDATFRASGGEGPAYGTIVGSGANACVLHYVDNDDVIADGALVLLDAGAQYGLYNGDVTRTYPASGRFTKLQRRVYDTVDRARREAIAAVRPGAPISGVHDAATRVLVSGLVELGALAGDLDSLVEEEAHKPFFPHQTSHWLGLDVHDPGDYARGGSSRALEAGMVFTIEPGLYFRPDRDETPAGLAGIGVRIEDDVLVTDRGCEVLSAGLPTEAGEVEALIRRSR